MKVKVADIKADLSTLQKEPKIIPEMLRSNLIIFLERILFKSSLWLSGASLQ